MSGESENAKRYHVLGNQQYNLGNHQRALQYFDLSIAADPSYGDSWLGKGVILYSMGKYEEAIECYDRAIKGRHDPTNMNSQYIVKEGNLEIHPHNQIVDFALHNKGLCYVQFGQWTKALECFEQALSLNPIYVDAWVNKARTLASDGKIEEAITSYDEAIRLNPDSFHIWYNKGISLTLSGRWEQSLPCYDEALKISAMKKGQKSLEDLAGEVGALDNKGYCLAQLGRYEEALNYHAKALEINPNHQNALINQGNALYGLARYKDAVKSYKKATEINPGNGLAWYHLGNALEKVGKRDSALSSFDRALKLSPPSDIAVKIQCHKAAIFRHMKNSKKHYNAILKRWR